MSNDYQRAYDAGFNAGWEAAKRSIEDALKQANDRTHIPYSFVQGCEICGIGKNGEPLGVACQHPSCPKNATFTNMISSDLNNDK